MKNDLLLVKIKKIKLLYGLNQDTRGPIDELFSGEATNISEVQHAIIDFILNDPYLSKFPPNRSYRIKFLKNIIKLFEDHNWELNEQILNRYIDLINENNDVTVASYQDETHFLVFFSKNDISRPPVVVEQNSSVISNGTTGLHAWPACFQMIEFLESRMEDLLSNK